MPRKLKTPEYNKPEIDLTKERYKPAFIAAAYQRLCTRCLNDPCLMLPLTTKGEDCPYFEERPQEEEHD